MSSVLLSSTHLGYTFSIVSLLLLILNSSYSASSDVRWTGGSYYADEVSGWYMPAETFYIPGRGVDRGSDSTVESYVILPPYIDPVEPCLPVVRWVSSSSSAG